MKQKIFYFTLVIAVMLTPIIVGYGLIRVYEGATFLDFTPTSSDEIYYWHQIATFGKAGFNGGYYSVSEVPARAEFSHFYAWGIVMPVLHGTAAKLFGWYLFSMPIVNMLLLTAATGLFIYTIRPDKKQLLLLGAVLATFNATILYLPTSKAQIFYQTLALILASGFYLLFTRPKRLPRFFLPVFVAFITLISFTRITWMMFLFPAFFLASEQKTLRAAGLALIKSLPFMVVALLALNLSAPYPNFRSEFFSALRVSVSDALQLLQEHIALNLSEINNGGPHEISLRYQVFFLLIVWGWAILGPLVRRRKRRKLSDEQKERLWETGFHLFNLGGILILLFLIHDIFAERGFRIMAPHLLLSLSLLIALKHRWLVVMMVASMILLLPSILPVYEEWSTQHFSPDHRQSVLDWGERLEDVIVYNPDTPNAWCNSLLHTYQYFSNPEILLAVDKAVGLSWLYHSYLPYKSRYLLFDDGTYNYRQEQLNVEPLLTVPDGRLYLNLDADCP